MMRGFRFEGKIGILVRVADWAGFGYVDMSLIVTRLSMVLWLPIESIA